LLQLSLCAVTVTSSQISHVVIPQHKDANSCERNEQVLSELNAMNDQLHAEVAQLQEDLAMLNANSASNTIAHKNTTGELKKQVCNMNCRSGTVLAGAAASGIRFVFIRLQAPELLILTSWHLLEILTVDLCRKLDSVNRCAFTLRTFPPTDLKRRSFMLF